MDIDPALQRAALLFGADKMRQLSDMRVLIFGVGGVGSWCAEALVRSGIGHLTMVDADDVDISNINRQLPASMLTLGLPKVDVLAERFHQIRPDIDICAVKAFYSPENADTFDLAAYDVVIDAIDSVESKMELIRRATAEKGLKFLSSMGAARRLDPGAVKTAEFWKVKGCPLARALRDRFKKEGNFPHRKFQCVYSDEAPSGLPKGTSMAVTATFGLRLAALALQ